MLIVSAPSLQPARSGDRRHVDNRAITPSSAHEFFTASASVAGALIGLLFVAIAVVPERVLGPEASEVHSVRAAATLTAFTNALTVSLFALIPGFHVGATATAVSLVGLLFVLGALLAVAPAWRAKRIRLREVTFLAGLVVVFALQLVEALRLDRNESNTDALQTVCVLVVVCFLVGIERAWELVGGRSFGLWRVLAAERRKPDEDA